MTPGGEPPWERIQQLFDACVDLPAAGRETLLAAEPPEVRLEVASLLAANDRAGLFLAGAPERQGARLGPYLLLAKLGEGGMGTVWDARREDGAFDQRVAIKIVREHFDTAGNLERFRAERQVLARLSHPNICRLLDGGETSGGLPYLVMEHIDGSRIDEYCRDRGLSVEERIRLVLPLCAAVEYAHVQGVLHRDVKPANILVNREGEPKLVDFGIARALAPESSSVTRTGNRMASLDYASPEHLNGSPLTAASDVYSLGVTLYELFAGEKPFPASTSSRETLPPRPSATARRAGQSERTARSLEGDLDTIVLKAMHPDAGRRYQSAAELAADLDRHARGLPVHARADSLLYRAGRHLRRRRALVASALAAFVLGIGAWSAWQRLRAPNPALRSIAVVSRIDRKGDPSFDWLESGFTATLTSSLEQSGAFRVISPNRVSEVMRQVSGDAGVRLLNADLLAEAALSKDAGAIRLQLHVRDIAAGKEMFAQTFSAASPEVVFSLADQAAAAVVARLTRVAPAPIDSRKGLTAIPDALRAYEDGAAHFARFDTGKAVASFRRAAQLDPSFALAYSSIAEAIGFFDRPAARGAILRAAGLAISRSLPRREVSFIQGLQLYFDGRLEEAIAFLNAVSREFAGESRPLLWLGMAQMYQWQAKEAQATFHRLVELSPKHELGWLMLAESAAASGDSAAAGAAASEYCGLIGAATRNCKALRGDLLAYAERWEESIAAFHGIDPGDPEGVLKPAVLLWFKGDLDAARREALKETRALAPRQFILGNIEVARGRLGAAAGLYEDSARQYKSQMFRYQQLLKAAELWLELGAPAEVLNMTARHESPWLPGLRATAYLAQGNRPSAEAELSALRASLFPIVGEHMAVKTEQFHRLLGAFYAARYNEVVETASALPASLHNLTALPVARSLIALNRSDEARRHLDFLGRSRLAIGAPEIYEQLAALRLVLAEYYLGEIAEQQGLPAEARDHYRRFVSAVPPEEGSLPQFAKARAALRGIR